MDEENENKPKGHAFGYITLSMKEPKWLWMVAELAIESAANDGYKPHDLVTHERIMMALHYFYDLWWRKNDTNSPNSL